MLNHIAIHGRLVRDPESRQTPTGVSVCNFTVAVDRSFTRQGEEKQTDYFDCVAWRGLADTISKYFTKGKEIVVLGEMQSRKWQDKDGNNRTAWEIIASSVDFCGNKGNSSNDDVTAPVADAAPAAIDVDFQVVEKTDSDLPF